jgi:Tol biopolymer transport system component
MIQSLSFQKDGHFSYNGKWLAYQSDESGKNQIYAVSFPAVDRKRQISNDGGVHPKWREDGKEIYYLSPGGKMMAVDILADTKIESETPRPLFDANINVDPNKDQYAVAPDGQRFLLLRPITETKLIPITVILNWTSLLKK